MNRNFEMMVLIYDYPHSYQHEVDRKVMHDNIEWDDDDKMFP